LQESEEYQTRFKANQERIKKGLAVLTPAEYLNVEDGYRQVLRSYGLKQFDTDDYVQQFIANDVSPTELSNRVVTAVQRVQNADPAITQQLREYYGLGQPDLVAYVLDPNQQFQKIERQVAAAEIGVAAARQGLQAGVSVAEQLAAQGISQAEAQKGYATIADILPTAEKLSDIYGTTLDGYGQSEAEQEVFNSLASAQRKRQRLTARELAAFSGSSGVSRTSLTTSNVGQF
jgi:DNA-binding PucR family transcriptional regulator